MNRNRKHLHIGLFFMLLLLMVICTVTALFGTGELESTLSLLLPRPAAAKADSRLWLPSVSDGRPIATFCLGRTTTALVIITGSQKAQYNNKRSPLPENGIIDARTAAWNHVHDYPVVVEGGPDICFSGGAVYGDYAFSETWERMHNTTGLTFRSSGRTTVENIRVHNYGDGISFSRGDPNYSFRITGAWMTHIRDDCVQNDYMYSGLIDDSLFDGCYTAFSAQTHKGAEVNDGSKNVWTIQNSLIRLEPMEKVYNDQGLIPGHGAFFKWSSDNTAPHLALHNNVFRVDQPSNSSNGLGIPDGRLVSCTNNVIVWLGDGPFPNPLPETFNGKPCFTITTDPNVWDTAVMFWKLRHNRQ